jgi:hypothetical protein
VKSSIVALLLVTDILGTPKPSTDAFLSDAVSIHIEHLEPQTSVTLRLEMDDQKSEAVYRANAEGVVEADAREREKQLKYHGWALAKLKLRLRQSLGKS